MKLTHLSIICFAILLSISYSNCFGQEVKNKSSSTQTEYSDKNSPLRKLIFGDSLKIMVRTSDCGEWGGHHETITIFHSNERNIYSRHLLANLLVDTINCNDRYQKKVGNVVIDTTLILTKNDETLLSNFILGMCEISLKGGWHIGNYGDDYLIIYTSGELKIKFWNANNNYHTGYYEMRKKIFRR
jgi:hypothetical protein